MHNEFHTDDNTNDECESQKPSGSNTITSTGKQYTCKYKCNSKY